MKKEIETYVRHCLICQKTKTIRHTKSPFQSYAAPNARFEHINIDIVGPFPLCDGLKYCLTMIDRFSKWIEVIPISDMTAVTIANEITKHWIARFGTPLRITSDQGRQFESEIFHELTKILGIQHLRTTGYHPQANGIIERLHRTLKAAIMAKGADRWPHKLPIILLALRSMYKEELNASPAEALYGQNLRLPGDLFESSAGTPKTEFVKQLKNTMEDMQAAPTNWNVDKQPFIHKDLEKSSLVFVRNDKIKTTLIPPYEGPYEVFERNEKYFTIIVKGKNTKISIDRLKPAIYENED